MTKEEAYLEFEETLGRLTQEYEAKKGEARAILRGRLEAIWLELHQELKKVRTITQKVR